jgi:hypothetical protein
VDEKIGATLITIFTSINNSSAEFPRTIGLKIIAHINNFNFFTICIFVIGGVILFCTYSMGGTLDVTPKEKF